MKNVSREFVRGNKQGLKLLNDLNMHILLKWYLVVFFYIKSFAFLKTLLRFMLRLFWSYLCNSKRSNFLLKLYSPLHIGYSTVDIQHIVFKSSLIWVVSFLMMNQHMSCILKMPYDVLDIVAPHSDLHSYRHILFLIIKIIS